MLYSTIANYYLVCSRAVRSAILATAWLLVVLASLINSSTEADMHHDVNTHLHNSLKSVLIDLVYHE